MKKENIKRTSGRHKAMSWDELIKNVKEAKKNPEFVKEVKRFIRATTR